MNSVRIHEFGGPEKLKVNEIEKPVPGEGEVLIKTAAAGINFADIMLRQNKYLFSPQLPFTLGFEVAGTIAETGEGVANAKLGQSVLATIRGGGYAEYAVANATNLVPIPEGIGFGEATALLVQGLTALALVADLKAGQNILVHAAAGGVGSLLVQIAKLRGATVIGTASSTEKLDKISLLGADNTVNYTEADWTDQILKITENKGCDVIIEMVGGEVGRQNQKVLAAGGTMHVYGAVTGEDFQISALSLLSRMQSIKGYNLNLESRENIARFTGELIKLVGEKKLKIEVTEFQLKNASDAHRAIEGRKTTGKVVLIP